MRSALDRLVRKKVTVAARHCVICMVAAWGLSICIAGRCRLALASELHVKFELPADGRP